MSGKCLLLGAVIGALLLPVIAEAKVKPWVSFTQRDKQKIISAVNQQFNRGYTGFELSGKKQQLSRANYKARFSIRHDITLPSGAVVHGGCTGTCKLGLVSRVSDLNVIFTRAAPVQPTRAAGLRRFGQP